MLFGQIVLNFPPNFLFSESTAQFTPCFRVFYPYLIRKVACSVSLKMLNLESGASGTIRGQQQLKSENKKNRKIEQNKNV